MADQRREALAFLLSLTLGVLCMAVAAVAADTGPRKAVGSVELTDAAGDATPISTGDKEYPGFDVVNLAFTSDGKTLSIAATLQSPPGEFASDVVELHIDTDNNAKTGADLTFMKVKGFEYKLVLDACADYTDGASACVGGSSKAKVKKHWAAVNLERFKSADQNEKETVVDSMGFPGSKASPQTPIAGKVVQAAIDYADLKVKPGQTIRILAKESCGYRAEDSGLFPEVLLTLK